MLRLVMLVAEVVVLLLMVLMVVQDQDLVEMVLLVPHQELQVQMFKELLEAIEKQKLVTMVVIRQALQRHQQVFL